MWQRNNGKEEVEKLQNRFTAYLVTAVRRKRTAYMNQRNKLIQTEYAAEGDNWTHQAGVYHDMFEELPLLMHLENDRLFYALKYLNERERYIFLERVLNEVSFEELAVELGLSYKGVAAIYYRTVQKIKKQMKGMNR